MANTLKTILDNSTPITDLTSDTPSGDDLTQRIALANRALSEAAETGQFSEFDSFYEVYASAMTISLPSNFRELKESPQVMSNGVWEEYEEIPPRDRYLKNTSDKFSYVLGNPVDGYNLVVNNFTSAATVSILYQRTPSGFATLTDLCELADHTYISSKVEAYILMARKDERFPTAMATAERKLQNTIAREAKTPGGQTRKTRKPKTPFK